MKIKTRLPYKFAFICILFCIIGFYLVSTVVYREHKRKIIEQKSEALYTQSYCLSNIFAPYFRTSSDLDLEPARQLIDTMAAADNIRIQIILPDGLIAMDSGQEQSDTENPPVIKDFSSGYWSNSYWNIGDFWGTMSEETLSVNFPVSSNFQICAYVVIHMPLSVILKDTYSVFAMNYISYGIMAVFIVLFLMVVIWSTHRPLKEIVKATEEYSKGNLSYVIKKKLPNDEIGRLGVSLNYMADKLDEMDSFQKKFVSNVSHDFRSPLTSIKGYLEAIEDGTIPPEMSEKYIKIMLFETERLTKLTNNLLTLNDIDPKSVNLDITAFDINNIIKHTIETFEGICKDKRISFELTFTSKQLIVNADMGKIQQVIYNLVDNAIKFSPNNSHIYISTTEKGDKALISVKDKGCGIPKEVIGKIWDRFYKSDSSRGRDKKGSGLGLSIVREIIKAHSENIDVISTEGAGTEFIFTLPKAKI